VRVAADICGIHLRKCGGLRCVYETAPGDALGRPCLANLDLARCADDLPGS